MEPGKSWRKHCWTQARADLLPHLPIEVLRGRLKRAAELGLDYRTYASVRASSGQDVVAVLFSSNALRLHVNGADVSPDRAEKLQAVIARRIGLASAPLTAGMLRVCAGALLDAAEPAPDALAPHGRQRGVLRQALGKIPGDQALLVGAYALEQDWVAAGRLAGYIDAARYFARR